MPRCCRWCGHGSPRPANVDPGWIASLSIIFIVARILHGVLYLNDKATLRSVVWTLGFACVVALLILAAVRIGAPVVN